MSPRILLVSAALLVSGCAGGNEPASTPEPSDPSSGAASPSEPGSPSPSAVEVPRPEERACYVLAYDEALAPTSSAEPADCDQEHSSRTFAVGDLDLLVDGHLLAVDSDRAQGQPAEACPQRLTGFLGGSEDDLRLSVLRAVWFSPSVEESDAGAGWYRCDVIALAGAEELAPLTGRLEGLLGRPDEAARYGLCGTAEPGTDGFERVACSEESSWRALSVVELAESEDYPGEDAVSTAGEGPCEDAGREAAADPLNFRWGYEWPSAEQWDAGQRYGVCWVPA